MWCHDLEEELETLKTKMESKQKKIKQLELQRGTLENEKKVRDTKIKELREVNARLIIFDPRPTSSDRRDEDSSQTIKKLKEDNERLARERKKLEEEMSKYRSRVSRKYQLR